MKKLPLYTAMAALSLSATSQVFASEICDIDALRNQMGSLIAEVKATPKTDPRRAELLDLYFETKAEYQSCRAIIQQAQWVEENCDLPALRTEMSDTMEAMINTPKTDPARRELYEHYNVLSAQYDSCEVAIAEVQDYIDNNGTDSETTIPSNDAPQIAISGANPLYVSYKGEFADPGATATDKEDGTVAVSAQGAVNTQVASGHFTITYTAQDSAGNQTQATRQVIVGENTTPTIALQGDEILNFVTHSNIEELDFGAIANDVEDGELQVFADYSAVDTTQAGEYTVVYTANDLDGASASISRTIVLVDPQPATLALLGSEIIDMEIGDVFYDPGYVAMNSTGEDVTNRVRVSDNVNTNQAGVYTVNYEFENGNNLVTAERKVVVNTQSCPDTCTTGCIKLAAHHMQCATDFPGAQQVVSNPVSIDASQTTCTAPCGVHFIAEANGDYGVESNFHHLSYHWDFGDAKSFFRSLDADFAFGGEANRAQGMYAAHVFAEPGEYEVTLYTAAKNGRYSNSTITITVQAPEEKYSASETICVSSSSDFEGCPTGAAHYRNWDAMTDAVKRMSRAYVVLRAGDEFDMNNNMILRTGDYVFDRFGEGEDPVIHILNSKTPVIAQDVKAISVANWQLVGDYDPKIGIGNSYGSKGLYFGQGDSFQTNNVTVHRTSIKGLGMCFSPRGGEGQVFADNVCTDWQDYGSLSDYTYRLAFVGNSIRQNPEAFSGGDQKNDSKTEHTANGTQRTFSYTFNVLAENDMAVQIEDANGSITELTLGSGYTLNMSNKTVALASVPKSGDLVRVYHRLWADHGSLRIADARNLVVAKNDLFNNVGWFGVQGEHHNPALRYNTDGEANHSGVIVENLIQGGTMAAVFEPANTRIGPQTGKAMVERNIFTGTHATYYGVRSAYGNMTMRNNVVQQPNVETITNGYDVGILFWEAYNAGNGADPVNFQLPVEVYNNTIINLSNDTRGANGRINWVDFKDVSNAKDHTKSTETYKDFISVNGVAYAPQANLAEYHNDPSFNETFHMIDELSQPAMMDMPGLFDTLWGYKRSENTTAGATEAAVDYIEAAPINVLNNGTF
ncbi:immunoglobulin-like domain-containing protein [Marinibactrum halimedae]|uniref:PKD domain-containing protein n=1 Tax=Marinibactrum halimedae TaxID=1444977 RepID=A0AA37T4N0_9GAMM|nr:immunoglobulin-like domain-containing protein [Marinibactrum halimedae]MCD9459591.1 DUF5011 domain-containing protein [Marinibactrum halimedae]GLS25591.1 hypothetical protein GCM10007877_13050 [Marinibactrum halimedae]